MKIGFCFLIYDIINHEDIWYDFFKNIDPSKYDIYIHFKKDEKLKYFQKNKISNCIETNYAHVSLIHAYNLLFQNAYNDNCDKFIILSNSCIPLKPFNYIYDFLKKDDLCYFDVDNAGGRLYPRCNNLLNYYKEEDIKKSSAWFILNREVCELVAFYDKNKIEEQCSCIYAPEEHFYITLISSKNLFNKLKVTYNESDKATTFTNWGCNYKFPSNGELKNYSSISEEEIKHLQDSDSLFGRKFNAECSFPSTYLDFIKS